MPKRNPMTGIKKAFGLDADEPQAEEAEGQSEAAAEAQQEKEEAITAPSQAAPVQQAEAKPEPQPIPAEELLKNTRFLPLVPIHYFLIVPVQGDEHKILVGFTIENTPVVKIQASGSAIANLRLALDKA